MDIVIYDLEVSGHHLQHVDFLVRYFLEKGNRVVFVTWSILMSQNRLPPESDMFKIEYVSCKNKYNKKNILFYVYKNIIGLKFVFNYAKTRKIDVVHLMCLERIEIPLFFLLLKKFKFKIFATLVVPYFFDINLRFFSFKRLYYFINRKIIKYLLWAEDITGLFVLSEATKKRLLRDWGGKFIKKIIMIPDPVETLNSKNISQKEARKKINIDTNKNVILYFGTLSYDKGWDLFVRSISESPENCVFIIAGNPIDNDNIWIEQFKNRFNDKVIISDFGFISDKMVVYYYMSADAVILPYRDSHKGTSGILQHSISMGIPVISTLGWQIKDVIKKWEIGLAIIENISTKSIVEGVNIFISNKDNLKNRALKIKNNYTKEHHWKKMTEIILKNYRDINHGI